MVDEPYVTCEVAKPIAKFAALDRVSIGEANGEVPTDSSEAASGRLPYRPSLLQEPAVDAANLPLRQDTHAYSPTVAAALARKSEPSRMYVRATATLVWRVWRMMSRSSAPAIAAAVASPARRLWPA